MADREFEEIKDSIQEEGKQKKASIFQKSLFPIVSHRYGSIYFTTIYRY